MHIYNDNLEKPIISLPLNLIKKLQKMKNTILSMKYNIDNNKCINNCLNH